MVCWPSAQSKEQQLSTQRSRDGNMGAGLVIMCSAVLQCKGSAETASTLLDWHRKKQRNDSTMQSTRQDRRTNVDHYYMLHTSACLCSAWP